MSLEIKIPTMEDQIKLVAKESIREAIEVLEKNLEAPVFTGPDIDEEHYPRAHLLRKHEGWEAPHPEIVRAYFENFKDSFPEYGSDRKLAHLLGISSDRRIREFKQGAKKVPYEIWRKFLKITGRAPQDFEKVLGFFS